MKAKILTLGLAMLAALTGFAGAAKGSCISKAKSLSGSQTAVLVNEYDPDEKEYYGSGVMYYTVTLKRGQSYTVWITGGNAAEMSLDVDTNWKYYEDKEIEPGASFEVNSIDSGATQVAYLYADDWTLPESGDEKDDYDPKEGKYVVMITGDIGASTTVGFTSGIRNFTITGSEDSPKVLSMANSWKSYSSKMVDGEFHFKATLKAGRKYRVRTTGGSSTKGAIAVDVDSGVNGDDESETEYDETVTPDVQYTNAYNDAWVVVPEVTAKYAFTLQGADTQAFKFYYTAIPTRSITAHPSIPLLEENEYSAQFVPGRVANTQSYYDEIIDEHLCKIYLPKGARWTFETEGATQSQKMIAYGPTGKILSTNESMGDGGYDTRVTISATTAGVYYVGVCDPLLDVYDTPTGGAVILKGRDTSGLPAADAWDSTDDVYTRASLLVPYPSETNAVVSSVMTNDAAVALGAAHGPHAMNANDYYDCFAIACRKGYVYKLRGKFTDENDQSDLTLSAKVFNIKGKVESAVTTTGTLSPITAQTDALDDLTFKATTNAIHYIRVWVNEGRGLDFPGYSLYAIGGVGTNTTLGLVKVESIGAPGTWSINTEKMSYPSGASLLLGKNDALTIKANAVSGFTAKPASQVVAIPVWEDGAGIVTVTNKYYDNYDAKYVMSTKKVTNAKTGKVTTTYVYSPANGDDTPAGAFAITPPGAPASVKRTLWTEDVADTFAFTASSNVYYNFSVTNTFAGGDAMIVVSNAMGVVTNGTEISRLLLNAGKTYVTVVHGTEAKADSTYTLTYSRAAPGQVKFTTSSFVVKEGSEYAQLTLARTGSEGAVRVGYATQAGTALPGTNYYPVTDGVVSWTAGNKSTKTIKVRMIPDLQAHWASSNLTFNVRLFPVDEYDLATGEYPVILGLDQAKVTIQESTAKKPGTISLAAYGDGMTDTRVTNVKAPAVKGIAGSTVKLTFERSGGIDGKVAVKVASKPLVTDTAKAGIDYVAFNQTLIWEDGDGEPKTVDVELPAVAGFTASKKFTLSMAVVNTGTKPTLSGATGTFTVLNETVAQTAAAYAKTIASSTGLTLVSTGTWFNDRDGTLRSANAVGTLTYTLTGPGLFVCEPKLVVADPEVDMANLICQIGTEKIDCTVEDFSGRIARAVGSGKTVVKFSLADVHGDAYAAFTPQADGAPYQWTPFSKVTPVNPMTKAVVLTNQTTLAWDLPATLAAEEGFCTRVRFGTTSAPATVIANDFAKAGEVEIPAELVPGKTYYWALDYAYTPTNIENEAWATDLKWVPGTTWNFSVLKTGAPITAVQSGMDAAGNQIADLLVAGKPVELIQGVKVDLHIGGAGDEDAPKPLAANQYRLLGGALPKGVSINGTTGVFSGCPTTVGESTALLQSFNKTGTTVTKTVNGVKKKVTTYTYTYGSTMAVTFKVLPAGTSVGSFRAVVAEDGGTFVNDARRQGLVTFSATSAGKLTAKLTLAGNSYTFTATGYDEIVDRDDAAEGVQRHFRVKLANTTTINKKSYKNYLTLLVADGPTTNLTALAEMSGKIEELVMNVPNAKKTAVTADIVYTGDLYRFNGGTAEGAAANAPFAGYYTASLVPEGTVSAADGVPVGNGYLTFTLSGTGSFKVSGVLADGTSVACSTAGQLLSDGNFYIPFYAGSSAYSLAGVLKIASIEGDTATGVLKPSAGLLWTKNASATTSLDGTGFAFTLQPVGGWYDKVQNLQTYYLNEGFAITAGTGEDLPAGARANGYSFTTLSTPQDLGVKFTGNTLVADAYKAVKNNTTGLTDFDDSVNPWNVSLKFTRATGIITGTFNAWEWVIKNDLANAYQTKQKTITKLATKGVLLFSRDADEKPLDDNIVAPGFFLMPNTTDSKLVSKKWKASLPFNVISTGEGDGNYEEREFDDTED